MRFPNDVTMTFSPIKLSHPFFYRVGVSRWHGVKTKYYFFNSYNEALAFYNNWGAKGCPV